MHTVLPVGIWENDAGWICRLHQVLIIDKLQYDIKPIKSIVSTTYNGI